MSEFCLQCKFLVTSRQHALQCDGCNGWQHRKCNTGVSLDQYRDAVRNEKEIDWKCASCKDISVSMVNQNIPSELVNLHAGCGPVEMPAKDLDDSVVSWLIERYGQGKVWEEDCPSCGRVVELHSAGVHVKRSGSLKVYSDDDVLFCPRCFYKDPVPSDDYGFEIEEPSPPIYTSENNVCDQDEIMEAEDESAISDNTDTNKPPPAADESSILDPVPQEVHTAEPATTFHVIEKGMKRGKPMLVDNVGFTYNVSHKRSYATYWQCTVRPRGNHCKASVVERDGMFNQQHGTHNHAVELGTMVSAQIMTAVKEKALKEKYKPASEIVNEVLVEQLPDRAPCPALPKPSNIARAANRLRQQNRPKDPKDLNFEINKDCIPKEFLLSDVWATESRRHLIFGTQAQLQYLEQAKTWYVDATFRLVRNPFKQLFTINAFVKSDKNVKQFPLVFVIMSGKRKEDYVEVLSAIKNMLTDPSVQQVTLDFETAEWQAFREVFPGVQIQGCVFHWTQAVWRKVQELGLTQQYKEDDGTYKYIRKLLALPFLPPHDLKREFRSLKEEATTGPLVALTSYIDSQWLHNDTFRVRDWSAFRQPVRTNNDIEGWHSAINKRAGKSHLPLYMLVDFLYQEAKLTLLNIKLVSDGKVSKVQRKSYRKLQGKIMKAWDDYQNQEKTASQLLKTISKLNGPARST